MCNMYTLIISFFKYCTFVINWENLNVLYEFNHFETKKEEQPKEGEETIILTFKSNFKAVLYILG